MEEKEMIMDAEMSAEENEAVAEAALEEEISLAEEMSDAEAEEMIEESILAASGDEEQEKKPGARRSKRSLVLGAVAGLMLVAILVGLFAPALLGRKFVGSGKDCITVNGDVISETEFSYYMNYMIDMYAYQYQVNVLSSEETFQAMKAYVSDYLVDHYVLFQWAKEEGYTVTDEIMADTLETVELLKSHYETEEDYKDALAANSLTEELYIQMMNMDSVISEFTAALVSENSPYSPDDKEAAIIAEAEGYYGAKHILILKQNDESKNEESKKLVQDLLARIRKGEDFDTLMNEYCEDPGLETNPNGYTFGAGEMVDEFYEGTKAIQIGDVSDIVETTYGWHIIMRVEPDLAVVKQNVATSRVDVEYSARCEKAVIQFSKAYDKLTASDYERKA